MRRDSVKLGIVSTNPSSEPSQSIQRVKVGMTGLALVLLLIGLASAIFSTASREQPVVAAGAAQPEVVANMVGGSIGNETRVKEPLAELGVTPSAATEALNETKPSPTPSSGNRP